MTPGGKEEKLKRKSRAMDPDLRWLKAADKACRMTRPRMRRALLEYLYDKFLIRQPAWLREFDRKRQRSLVLRAQQETAKRCAWIAQEQAHRNEGSSLRLGQEGDPWNLAQSAKDQAVACRTVELKIREEFALAGREGEEKL